MPPLGESITNVPDPELSREEYERLVVVRQKRQEAFDIMTGLPMHRPKKFLGIRFGFPKSAVAEYPSPQIPTLITRAWVEKYGDEDTSHTHGGAARLYTQVGVIEDGKWEVRDDVETRVIAANNDVGYGWTRPEVMEDNLSVAQQEDAITNVLDTLALIQEFEAEQALARDLALRR